MTKQNKVYSLLGFAAKSGKIAFGFDAVLDCIRYGKARIVIVATDASEKTKKNIQFICNQNNVKLYIYGIKDDLSHSIGKKNKVVFAVKEKNLAEGIKKIIDGGDAVV